MDQELKMLANLPIQIDDVGFFYVPTLRDLAAIGEQSYNEILSLLLIDKNNIPSLKNEDVSDFIILWSMCLEDKNIWLKVKFGLELMFKEVVNISPSNSRYAYFYLGANEDNRHIHRGNFDIIKNSIITSNHIKIDSEEEYNPSNKRAADLIAKLQAGKQEILKLKKNQVSLLSKVSGLAWKSNSINIFNVFDLNIFQFYDALSKVEQIDNYLFTMQGIYAGTVDGSKIKINNIHWGNNFS